MFDGQVLLGGAITRSDDILAAQATGADLAYMGTRFLAATEANVVLAFRQAGSTRRPKASSTPICSSVCMPTTCAAARRRQLRCGRPADARRRGRFRLGKPGQGHGVARHLVGRERRGLHRPS
ncbi:hypothetical protein J2W24_006215 [Variovorax boronicumulans]|uniref:hypothetical protein n=1 Tax=Variovorax boronicumulans TaxID=436515 RepID=UPI00277DB662|nr:hypothetical protein [Variovorax boronicumulans]MDP9920533.1 hypothetical protein [Variovorax boronicumulans]